MLADHRLLSVSAGVPRYPLVPWRALVEPLALSTLTRAALEPWCVANNNLALIHLYLGQVDAAHQTCERQIRTLFDWVNNEAVGKTVRLLILQPLVNLLRLSGDAQTLGDRLHHLQNFIFKSEATGPCAQLRHLIPDADKIRSQDGQTFLNGVIALCRVKTALRDDSLEGLEEGLRGLGRGVSNEVRFILKLYGWNCLDIDTEEPPGVFKIYHLRRQGHQSACLGDLPCQAFRVLVQQAEATQHHDLARTAVEFYKVLSQEELIQSIGVVEKLYRLVTLIGDEFDQYELLSGLSEMDRGRRQDWRCLAETTCYPRLKIRAREDSIALP